MNPPSPPAWGDSEHWGCGCIIEEEKPLTFEWEKHYNLVLPPEIKEAITKMETELVQAHELEQGGSIQKDPLWVAQILQARSMEERQSFGRTVEIALTTWRVDEEAHWRTMEDIRGLAEPPYTRETDT